RTLSGPLEWADASLLRGDLVDAVTGLKDRHAEVHVIGSLDLVQSLLRLGLVDRLQMWVYPLVLGKGKRLFGSGAVPATLRLVDSAVLPNGTLKLDFQTGGEPRFGNLGDPQEALRRLT